MSRHWFKAMPNAHGLSLARSAGRGRQVVKRRPPVLALDAGGRSDALNESGAVPHAPQMIDSTVVRAHHQAAGG